MLPQEEHHWPQLLGYALGAGLSAAVPTGLLYWFSATPISLWRYGVACIAIALTLFYLRIPEFFPEWAPENFLGDHARVPSARLAGALFGAFATAVAMRLRKGSSASWVLYVLLWATFIGTAETSARAAHTQRAVSS